MIASSPCCFFLPHLQAGLSMALGAFLAGLLLAETEFALQVRGGGLSLRPGVGGNLKRRWLTPVYSGSRGSGD